MSRDLVKAVANPRRAALLELLCEGEMSVFQAAKELGLPHKEALYHVAILSELGWVSLEGRRSAGGTIERFCKVTPAGWPSRSLPDQQAFQRLRAALEELRER